MSSGRHGCLTAIVIRVDETLKDTDAHVTQRCDRALSVADDVRVDNHEGDGGRNRA